MTEDYDEKYAYEATRLLHPCGVPLFFSYHPVVCASLRPPATICEPSGLNPVPDCDLHPGPALTTQLVWRLGSAIGNQATVYFDQATQLFPLDVDLLGELSPHGGVRLLLLDIA